MKGSYENQIAIDFEGDEFGLGDIVEWDGCNYEVKRVNKNGSVRLFLDDATFKEDRYITVDAGLCFLIQRADS